MPQAITHILIGIILIELFREYIIKGNSKFPRYYILIVAIGSVLPDIDMLVFYLLSFWEYTYEQIHGTFTHSLWFPIIFLGIGLLFKYNNFNLKFVSKKHLKLSSIFFILSLMSLLHITLDLLVYNVIYPFYPIKYFPLGFNLINYFPENIKEHIFPTIDGILLLFWILWMEFKLKISRYF